MERQTAEHPRNNENNIIGQKLEIAAKTLLSIKHFPTEQSANKKRRATTLSVRYDKR
jgi:hypothetical protein